jgi:hypothetical protein
MEPLKLEDIIPAPASFKLKALNDVELQVRPITAGDRIWMKQTFGDRLMVALQAKDLDGFARVVYRQLTDESKRAFRSKEVAIFNEETGEESKATLGGYKLLLALMGAGGAPEMMAIMQALNRAAGVTEEMEKRVVAELERDPEKKSAVETLTRSLIGEKSSTASPTSTAGAPSTSAPAPSSKSDGASSGSTGGEARK